MHLGYLVSPVQIVISALVFSAVRSELFTAIVELQKILVAEDSLASDLKEYIAAEETRLEKLKTLVFCILICKLLKNICPVLKSYLYAYLSSHIVSG